MKKIILLIFATLFLSACLSSNKKTDIIEDRTQMYIDNDKSKPYIDEIQGLINMQLKEGPRSILQVECEKKYSMKAAQQYCIDEQSRVKQLFKK